MGGLRRVDKACKKCGGMMYQVPSKRLYCDKCRDTLQKARTLLRKKELWKVFRKHRKELFAYTVRGEGEDEEEATISLLAYENHCKKSDIYVTLEMR